VLDTTLGRPAAGVEVRLERLTLGAPDAATSWHILASTHTNADGRASGLEAAGTRALGRHRISFETEAYFRRTGQAVFYPQVQVQFIIESPSDNYHVPLLLSPFGYSTYRGS
jgi:5-hydroxyisourate hydrolase